ncbi:MAG: hypothetical protein RRZ42_08775, partial [Oscillospiraceae bacterium]
ILPAFIFSISHAFLQRIPETQHLRRAAGVSNWKISRTAWIFKVSAHCSKQIHFIEKSRT